jgi:hypothetical protein
MQEKSGLVDRELEGREASHAATASSVVVDIYSPRPWERLEALIDR